MKIFMIHPHDIEHDPPTVRITSIASEFARKNHEVVICSFYDDLVIPEKLVKFQEFQHEKIRAFKLKRSRYALFSNIKRVIRESRGFDIIHLQKCLPYAALPALYASLVNNIPLHYDWDDNETAIAEDCVPSKFAVAEKMVFESLLFFFSETISTASEILKKKTLSFRFPPGRIVDSPVGADLDMFYPRDDNLPLKKELGLSENVVLYQGQIDAGNYAKIFVSASSLILEKSPDVSIVLVGGGFRLPEVRESAKFAGVEDKIVFTDFIRQRKVAEYIAASNVCVATFEDNEITAAKSPLKIAEYLASGKPIVASDVGEIRKMVGEAGILVPPGDIEKTAEAILDLLQNEEKRKKLSKSARSRAEKIYNWNSTSENILNAYQIAIRAFKK